MAQNRLTSTVNGPLLRTFVFIQNEYKVSMITYTGNTIGKSCNVPKMCGFKKPVVQRKKALTKCTIFTWEHSSQVVPWISLFPHVDLYIYRVISSALKLYLLQMKMISRVNKVPTFFPECYL